VNMEMDVRGEVSVRGRMRVGELEVGGEGLWEVGEMRCFREGVRVGERFLERWVKCDGKRVRRSDYYELFKKLGIEEENDEFYLPDIKVDGVDYYIKF